MPFEQYDPKSIGIEIAAAGVSIAECESENEAEFLSFVLGDAGIHSGVLKPHGHFDLRYPQVSVAPEDVDRARAVLAGPIRPKLREEFETPIADFEIPKCPKCASPETLLESAEPQNTWRCDDCGHLWT
jgi:hypothetical protein